MCLFAVLAELRQMQERISLIEAKLARRSHQSATQTSSSEQSLPASQPSADCVTVKSDRSPSLGQNSLHSSRQPSTVGRFHCFSLSTTITSV